jgi:hypothetical protein
MSTGAVAPSTYSISQVKHRLMQPSLTSYFHCYFNPPSEVQSQLKANQLNTDDWSENLLITCSDASLPGSTLATNDLNNDFTGVTQRHAYRRLYDDRADFTFYVNNKYTQIRVFESWLRYIAGEQLSFDSNSPNRAQFYRAQYPNKYKTEITITKFERDISNSRSRNKSGALTYTFVNAFPAAINSMPVSYDSSQLLKCTVSFSYDRYFASYNGIAIKESISPQTPEAQASQNQLAFENVPFKTIAFTDPNLNFNIAPSQFNYSPGTISNTQFEGEEIINATKVKMVEEGLPYVGRNVGPISRF